TDQQKFMVLVGEGANGKSTLVGGLLAVLGEANASHVSLEKFSGAFDLGYTLGKLVNVPDDMSEIDKANEGVLKTYTSGGAKSLKESGGFVIPACVTAAVAEHQIESNPTRLFLVEHLEPAEGGSIPSRTLYASYRKWMLEHGHQPMAHTQFTKELRRVYSGAR